MLGQFSFHIKIMYSLRPVICLQLNEKCSTQSPSIL